MTTYAPSLIRKCASCENHIQEDVLASGNACGARYWTDGKCDAPMLPDSHWLIACPHCDALAWIDELEQVGTWDWYAGHRRLPVFADAREPSEPSLEQYLFVLARPGLGSDKERYARIRAWWASNDRRREGGERCELSARERANLERLVQLLDPAAPNDRLMRAEILRELGRFGRALDELASPLDEDFAVSAAVIRSLAASCDPYVAEIG
jgi:hypothetical protein